jgi:hypothetical protein
MTGAEIDHFFNRVIFEHKLSPKCAERSREEAKRELVRQQQRMFGQA